MDASEQLAEARARHAQRHAQLGAEPLKRSPAARDGASSAATPADVAGASAAGARGPSASSAALLGTSSERPADAGSAGSAAPEGRSSSTFGVMRSAAALLGRALSAARRAATEVPAPPPPPPAFAVGQRVVYTSTSRPPARGVVRSVEPGFQNEPAAYVLTLDDDGREVHTVETRLAPADDTANHATPTAPEPAADEAASRAARRAAQEAEDAALAAALQAEEDHAAAAARAVPPPLAALGGDATPMDFFSAMLDMMSAPQPQADPANPTAGRQVERQFALPGGNGTVRVVFGNATPLTGLLDFGTMLLGGALGMGGDGMSYEQLLALQERLGGVSRGATAEQVAALPTRRFEPREGAEAAETTCSICLADFAAGDELRGLPCTHSFHTGCIDQWLKSSRQCPCCRREVTAQGAQGRA
jgi:hypothetical protein